MLHRGLVSYIQKKRVHAHAVPAFMGIVDSGVKRAGRDNTLDVDDSDPRMDRKKIQIKQLGCRAYKTAVTHASSIHKMPLGNKWPRNCTK